MIYYLTPSTHRTIWGGKKLEVLKNLLPVTDAAPLGETWEISTLPNGPSLCEGKPLEINTSVEELPYMVKLIDTGAALSIQVHPNDDYARIHENSSGKAAGVCTQSWKYSISAPMVFNRSARSS